MVKNFRFEVNFKVEINEKVEDKSIKRKGKINSLLKAFLKNDGAIWRLYQLWLINEIRHGYLAKAVLPKLKEESDSEIIEDVLKECPEKLREHFQAALEKDKKATFNDGYGDVEAFFGNFGLFNVVNVNFEMINKEGL